MMYWPLVTDAQLPGWAAQVREFAARSQDPARVLVRLQIVLDAYRTDPGNMARYQQVMDTIAEVLPRHLWPR